MPNLIQTTILHNEIRARSHKRIQELMKAGADPNVALSADTTALARSRKSCRIRNNVCRIP